MVRLEVPGHVLQHFWDLANVEAETRQTSAVRLVHELKSAQDAFSVSGAVSDAEMGDAADVGSVLQLLEYRGGGGGDDEGDGVQVEVLLEGGAKPGKVLEVCGGPGAGKTQLLLQVMR